MHLPLGLGVYVVRLVDYHAGQVVAAASKSNSGRALQALPPVHMLLPGYVRHFPVGSQTNHLHWTFIARILQKKLLSQFTRAGRLALLLLTVYDCGEKIGRHQGIFQNTNRNNHKISLLSIKSKNFQRRAIQPYFHCVVWFIVNFGTKSKTSRYPIGRHRST